MPKPNEILFDPIIDPLIEFLTKIKENGYKKFLTEHYTCCGNGEDALL